MYRNWKDPTNMFSPIVCSISTCLDVDGASVGIPFASPFLINSQIPLYVWDWPYCNEQRQFQLKGDNCYFWGQNKHLAQKKQDDIKQSLALNREIFWLDF